MIDIKASDIEALEIENGRLRNTLRELLEAPDIDPKLRKELERVNFHLTSLMSVARRLYEQNEIINHHTDHVKVDFWHRHPSTL